MTKPLVTIELDEYNKLINKQITSVDFLDLFQEIETKLYVTDEPNVLNDFSTGYNIVVNKRKLIHAIIEAYGITSNTTFELK